MSKKNGVGAVIVAAGESKRMGGQDKLFAPLGGEPLLARVIDAFDSCPAIEQIVVVIRDEKLAETRRMILGHDWSKEIDTCTGGERRQDSVKAGLEHLNKCEWVVIHDGARPLVTPDLIDLGLKTAAETGVAVAAVPVTDTIKVAGGDRIVQYTPTRESLWAVQTPQVFRSDIINKAYRRLKEDVTDDASLVEKMGHQVKLYRGSYDNIKVTTPEDLALAEVLWQKRQA
jgi:2-C-methyl-D-erythritol 4-phosphate cytidylyltransferase